MDRAEAATDSANDQTVEALLPLDPPTRLQCLLCREIFRQRIGPRDRSEEWSTATGELNADGIAELVRLAEAEASDERDRGRQLDAKTGSFAAFSGLMLTIDVALARSVFGLHLGSIGNILARVGLGAASIALLVAAALALGGVVMPQKYRGLAWNQVDEFGGPEFQTRATIEIHRAWLQSVSGTLAQNRAVNDCKARIIKIAAVWILIGFVGLTSAGLTLGIHSLASPAHHLTNSQRANSS